MPQNLQGDSQPDGNESTPKLQRTIKIIRPSEDSEKKVTRLPHLLNYFSM